MRKFINLSFVSLFLSLLVFPAMDAEAFTESPRRDSAQNYKIGVGDLLQIEVYDEDDLTKEVQVLTDGRISFPLIGSVKAAGLTVNALEKTITHLLGQKYLVNPQVTVFVKKFSSVFVFGEVREPGTYSLTGKMTAFEAIVMAGGFTEVANKSKVKVTRQEGGMERTYEVDVQQIIKKGDTSADLELQANDRVIVTRGFF